MGRAEALLALAAFIRLRKQAYSAAEVPIPLLGSGLTDARVFAPITQFVEENPESGKRGQALVAAIMDFCYEDVYTRNVHASSQKTPGDVVAKLNGAVCLSAEVKQKPVADHQVLGFVDALRSAGISHGMYVAIAPDQPALHWDALVLKAAALGVSLSCFTSTAALLAAALAFSPSSGVLLERLPERLMARLRDVDATRESQEEWARVVLAAGSAASG
jgi:hypothetical protein